MSWSAFKMNDFTYQEGKEQFKKIYKITQLLNSTELAEEGKTMKHCVASYANSCVAGRCSIWSMMVEDFAGIGKRLLTIEMDKNRNLVQIRGKYNVLPVKKEMDIIRIWADAEGLKMSKWIV